ncbi:MAG: hypothetical protein U9N60_02795 [Thermodesulfobacteriota bacterium]|nr:hypothetical protein [Thermodesulfobacteriota bacterium]
MFGSASQGGEQADQLYLGMLGSLIAFLWSAAEYLLTLVARVDNHLHLWYLYIILQWRYIKYAYSKGCH